MHPWGNSLLVTQRVVVRKGVLVEHDFNEINALEKIHVRKQPLQIGFRLDAPSAMVEETVAVNMPRGKAGLTALMTRSTPREAPPASPRF